MASGVARDNKKNNFWATKVKVCCPVGDYSTVLYFLGGKRATNLKLLVVRCQLKL